MKQSRDPIKNQFLIWLNRLCDFTAISIVLAVILWLYCLWYCFGVRELEDLWRYSEEAFDGRNRTCWLVARLCLSVACSVTTSLFLIAALWWKRAGERHHRGAQLTDERR